MNGLSPAHECVDRPNLPCPACLAAEHTPNVVKTLRIIRDKGWRNSRLDPEFSEIESLAEQALAELGVNDGGANPRPHGWWSGVK